MFDTGPKYLPSDFDHVQNLHRRSQAYANEAFRLAAKAERMEVEASAQAKDKSGDTISLEQNKPKIDEIRKTAEVIYGKALDLQNQHKESLTRFQKSKPTIMNSIIVVVVAAEILSIPILLDNIYQMRHRGSHAPLN